MQPLVVIAEFACSEEGDSAFRREMERTLAEIRAVRGCLQATLWSRPDRRYQFFTVFTDADALAAWVRNDHHRDVLMPAFRRWCTAGWFGELRFEADHRRARKCLACGRWSRGEPGFDEGQPASCGRCGAALPAPDASPGLAPA